MRLEKISDNQFRCILTGEDLAERQMQLAELAYGSEKAKRLFADLLQRAITELGFVLDGYPIMVEAIPMAGNGLTLVVTKVDNPEELDARYSCFSPGPAGKSDGSTMLSDIFSQVMGGSQPGGFTPGGSPLPQINEEAVRKEMMLHRLYCFPSMDTAARACAMVDTSLPAESFLYTDPRTRSYWLYIDMADEEAVAACQSMLATLSEYGEEVPCLFGRRQHAKEHYSLLAGPNALEVLADL